MQRNLHLPGLGMSPHHRSPPPRSPPARSPSTSSSSSIESQVGNMTSLGGGNATTEATHSTMDPLARELIARYSQIRFGDNASSPVATPQLTPDGSASVDSDIPSTEMQAMRLGTVVHGRPVIHSASGHYTPSVATQSTANSDIVPLGNTVLLADVHAPAMLGHTSNRNTASQMRQGIHNNFVPQVLGVSQVPIEAHEASVNPHGVIGEQFMPDNRSSTENPRRGNFDQDARYKAWLRGLQEAAQGPRLIHNRMAEMRRAANEARMQQALLLTPDQAEHARDGGIFDATSLLQAAGMTVPHPHHLRANALSSTHTGKQLARSEAPAAGATQTNNQLVHFDAPAKSPAHNNKQIVRGDAPDSTVNNELVKLITSGHFESELNGGRPAEPSPGTGRRQRSGRTIAKAFERHSSSPRNDRGRGNSGFPSYAIPRALQEKRERDAHHLATVNRALPAPSWLNHALCGKLVPTVEQAIQALPFISPLKGHVAPVPGVIRFVDPPHQVTKSEVLNCLGRFTQINSQPVGTPYHAVHIMMARDTGKTGDVFVEVSCHEEAVIVSQHFAAREREGRTLTLGRMTARVQLSSIEDMMASIFPFAKCVIWNGSTPIITNSDEEIYPGIVARGFDGFLGQDEAALMCKWLNEPGRSPFTARGPNRLYENVITLLHKYPLWATQHIMIKDRKRVFDIASCAIKSLTNILLEEDVPEAARLDQRLLQELVVAALSFPLFTEAQKASMVRELRGDMCYAMLYRHGMPVHLGGTHELATPWPFLALVREPGANDNLVRLFAKIIDQVAEKDLYGMTPAEIVAYGAARKSQPHANVPFLPVRVNYGITTEEDLANMSLQDCATKEMAYIINALENALPTKDY